ncbi:hypothetical protein WG66_000524 [Moniliophthora roreri]|nr:hypothetical protein WG66_000524 [Moniliophthora roreri]
MFSIKPFPVVRISGGYCLPHKRHNCQTGCLHCISVTESTSSSDPNVKEVELRQLRKVKSSAVGTVRLGHQLKSDNDSLQPHLSLSANHAPMI